MSLIRRLFLDMVHIHIFSRFQRDTKKRALVSSQDVTYCFNSNIIPFLLLSQIDVFNVGQGFNAIGAFLLRFLTEELSFYALCALIGESFMCVRGFAKRAAMQH